MDCYLRSKWLIEKRIKEINNILNLYPDMWPGPQRGFLAERTRLQKKLQKYTSEVMGLSVSVR
jgi:hypothetical protein